MNTALGFVLGALAMIIFTIFILLPISPVWMEENKAIVYIKNDGVVCKENKNYPKLNCLLIKDAIGPKLSDFEIKEK